MSMAIAVDTKRRQDCDTRCSRPDAADSASNEATARQKKVGDVDESSKTSCCSRAGFLWPPLVMEWTRIRHKLALIHQYSCRLDRNEPAADRIGQHVPPVAQLHSAVDDFARAVTDGRCTGHPFHWRHFPWTSLSLCLGQPPTLDAESCVSAAGCSPWTTGHMVGGHVGCAQSSTWR